MSNIFPGLNTMEIYSLARHPVYLPNLLIGLILTYIITYINYRGVRFSAKFQNWTTLGLLSLSAVVVVFALQKGKAENLLPAFSHSSVVSTLLVIQIVPYFMCGFESVTKSVEEASPRFNHSDFMKAILAGIFVGLAFYSTMIFVVSYSSPWKEIVKHDLAPAYALQQASHTRWIVQLIMIAALFSLVKIFNGNFLASSRLLFALGRRKMIYPRLADIHPRNRTPSVAIAITGIVTALTAFLGNSVLIPLTEVGSFAAACGFLATCCAYLWIEPTPSLSRRIIAALGISVSGAIVAMKLLPFIPGHFTRVEWLASLLWIAVGLLLRRREARLIDAVGSPEIV